MGDSYPFSVRLIGRLGQSVYGSARSNGVTTSRMMLVIAAMDGRRWLAATS